MEAGLTENHSESVGLIQSQSLIKDNPSGIRPPAIINRTTHGSKLVERQKLRVSAEGLIDIVTEEAANSGRLMAGKKESL